MTAERYANDHQDHADRLYPKAEKLDELQAIFDADLPKPRKVPMVLDASGRPSPADGDDPLNSPELPLEKQLEVEPSLSSPAATQAAWERLRHSERDSRPKLPIDEELAAEQAYRGKEQPAGRAADEVKAAAGMWKCSACANGIVVVCLPSDLCCPVCDAPRGES